MTKKYSNIRSLFTAEQAAALVDNVLQKKITSSMAVDIVKIFHSTAQQLANRMHGMTL